MGQTCETLQSSEASLEAPEMQATSSASLPLMSSLPQAWSTGFTLALKEARAGDMATLPRPSNCRPHSLW